MTKEEILKGTSQLIRDIDMCTTDLVEARMKHDDGEVLIALHEMERLMVGVHQELGFLYDYIKGLWKDAQGDDLPEIDRDVVALVGLEDNDYKVVFAHRVNTAGYNGKSLITGETIRYVPKGYDKGGWNQPNLRFWLDLPLPVKEGGEYDSPSRRKSRKSRQQASKAING